jgi:hypothetical protein
MEGTLQSWNGELPYGAVIEWLAHAIDVFVSVPRRLGHAELLRNIPEWYRLATKVEALMNRKKPKERLALS